MNTPFSRTIVHTVAAILATLIALAGLSGCGAIEKSVEKIENNASKYDAEVSRVIDGDTVAVKPTENLPQNNTDAKNPEHVIRILGINAPEMNIRKEQPAECGAKEATEFLGKTLKRGDRVSLTFDPSTEKTDRYGRSLAYLSSDGERDISLLLIDEGLAVPFYPQSEQKPERYDDYVENAQRAAQYRLGNYKKCSNFGAEFRQGATSTHS